VNRTVDDCHTDSACNANHGCPCYRGARFDEGYLGIDTSSRLHVSPRLRADFENGSEFYDRAGRTIDLPDARANRPGKEAVTWHMDTVYRSR